MRHIPTVAGIVSHMCTSWVKTLDVVWELVGCCRVQTGFSAFSCRVSFLPDPDFHVSVNSIGRPAN